MIEINAEWLLKLGVKASNKKEMDRLVAKLNAELELRIGAQLLENLTAKQIDTFDSIEDEDGRLEWLEKAYPDYKKVVETQYKAIGEEIRKAQDKVSLIKGWS